MFHNTRDMCAFISNNNLMENIFGRSKQFGTNRDQCVKLNYFKVHSKNYNTEFNIKQLFLK